MASTARVQAWLSRRVAGPVLVLGAAVDAKRAQQLADALRANGLPARFDGKSPDDPDWSAHERAVIRRASAVVLVWSQESELSLHFGVRGAIARLAKSKRLVVVSHDYAPTPAEAGKAPYKVLAGWRKGGAHPALLRLVDTVRQVRDPSVIRRLAAAGSALAIIGVAFAMLGNVLTAAGALELACKAPLDAVAERCGGLSAQDAKAERLAWDKLDPKSCDALRGHIQRYPKGPHSDDIKTLLAGARVTGAERKVIEPRRLNRAYLPKGELFSRRDAALRDAARRASVDAREVTCVPVLSSERLLSSATTPLEPTCRTSGEGVACGMYYSAICQIERSESEETCG